RHADHVRFALYDGGDKVFRRDVGAEIDDFESAALEHGGDNVLADVVQVAFDSADDDADRHLLAGGSEQRLEQFQGALHGAAGEQELRNEVFFALEEAADLIHGRNHGFLNEGHGLNAGGEG